MIRVFALLVLLASPAHAQPPDIASMQRSIAILQAQRNQAMDVIVSLEVQRALLAEEVERLKARIAELEKAKPQ